VDLYKKYLTGYVETLSWCLINNHFHFLVRIINHGDETQKIVSNQFRKLFIAFAMKINLKQERRGSLLTKNFKRVPVVNPVQMKIVVYYIHTNPVKHGISKDFTNYRFSSFRDVINNRSSIINLPELLSFFNNDLNEFIDFHLRDGIPVKDAILEKDAILSDDANSL
jgi:REP element-mobilizing transposase RayT